jgi:hypothetical protein
MENSERLKYIGLFCTGLGLTFLGEEIRESYQEVLPYLADSLTSYGRVVALSHGIFGVLPKVDKKDISNISILATLGYLTSEIAQFYELLPGTFDPKDLVAIVLGGLTSLVAGLYIKKKT